MTTSDWLDLLVVVLATPVAVSMLLKWRRFRTGRATPSTDNEATYALIGGLAFAFLALMNALELLQIL